MIVVDILLFLVVALLALPVAVVFVEVVAAVCLPDRPVPPATGPRAPLAVLVPAHDEALVIRATLERITPQLQPGDRLVVVADNCSDDTASIARACGAEVLERINATLRGKGYALDHGVRHLEAAPPAAVVIIDADCDVAPGTIDKVFRQCQQFGRPVQALYAMEVAPGGGAVSPISAFAWRLRVIVCPIGMHKLGGPCNLMGSGMAIPWPLVRNLDLASGHIAEDMKMGVDLARRGAPPMLCPQALVTSTFPVSRAGAASQRTRWEHGHIGMIVDEVPTLLRDAARGIGAGLLPIALEICIPPKALLVLLLLASMLVTALGAAIGASAWPFAVAAAELSLFTVAVMLAWARFARDILPLSEVPRIGLYVLAKIPLYLGFLVRRQVEWVRSKRDAD